MMKTTLQASAECNGVIPGERSSFGNHVDDCWAQSSFGNLVDVCRAQANFETLADVCWTTTEGDQRRWAPNLKSLLDLPNCPRKRRTKRATAVRNPPPSGMPENLWDLMQRMGGPHLMAKLVFEKKLSNSDINRRQNRFLMPSGKFSLKPEEFLNDEEKEKLITLTDNFLEVDFIEPCLDKTTLLLKKRDEKSYVFTSKYWHEVASKNKLEEDEFVSVWFFRANNGRPCFALVKLDPNLNLSGEGQAPFV